MAFVLLSEQVERLWLGDRQIAALQLLFAGEEGPLPTLAESMGAFEEALLAEPQEAKQLTPEEAKQLRLRKALGVA